VAFGFSPQPSSDSRFDTLKAGRFDTLKAGRFDTLKAQGLSRG
jgi:hypothetical protein